MAEIEGQDERRSRRWLDIIKRLIGILIGILVIGFLIAVFIFGDLLRTGG